MLVRRAFVFPLGLPVLCCACASNPSKTVTLPSFYDVFQAPAAIQTAAQAVVEVQIADGMATGSFISPDGLLLTNNHVLGVDECFQEGCYATIQRMYQRHATPGNPESVYAVPLAVDIGSDIAFVQLYSGSPSGPKLVTPSFLTINSATSASLLGEHVNIVGHPEGALKKWTSGLVVDTDGTWVYVDAFILPGNSGSPILTDDGVMVGIIHRAPTSQDLGTNVGIDEFAIGTASSAFASLITAASTGNPQLPPAMLSNAAIMTDDQVAAAQEVFLNSQVYTANVGGTSKPVIASLEIACEAALTQTSYSSPEDLDNILAPCTAGISWINCQSSDTSLCPSSATDTQQWSTLYSQVFNELQALNQQLDLDMVTSGPAGLQTTGALAQSVARQDLSQALAAAQPPLDFTIAAYCAQYGVNSYNGQTIVSYLRSYAAVPDYGLQGTNIVLTAIALNKANTISGTETIALLQNLSADDHIELGTKLYIEQILFNSNVID
jgi:S1-C subfamily serine protease